MFLKEERKEAMELIFQPIPSQAFFPKVKETLVSLKK
jgi:hypothetical protein